MKRIFLSLVLVASSLSFSVERNLIGKALLEYSWLKIDIYEVSYYKNSDSSEELVLDYKRDVKGEHSLEGWKVGLEPILKKNPDLSKKAEWIYKTTALLKEGEKLTLKRKGEEVTILKGSQIIANTSDADIANLIFYPWLGEKPIDKEIKQKLLGKS